jgi:hypothetical protein
MSNGTGPPLVLTNYAALQNLSILRSSWGVSLRVGLFQNPWIPRHSSTIAEVQPCDFSGYAGLLTLSGFGAPYLVGDIATMVSTLLTWTHNGGPLANWVNGYYVLDSLGNLMWAQKNAEALALAGNGQTYGVVPQFSLSSRF